MPPETVQAAQPRSISTSHSRKPQSEKHKHQKEGVPHRKKFHRYDIHESCSLFSRVCSIRHALSFLRLCLFFPIRDGNHLQVPAHFRIWKPFQCGSGEGFHITLIVSWADVNQHRTAGAALKAIRAASSTVMCPFASASI